MKRPERARISVLAGMLGFFAGGIIMSAGELTAIMLGAAVGWAAVFFAVFFILEAAYGGKDEPECVINDSNQTVNTSQGKNAVIKNPAKGKKVDYKAGGSIDIEEIFKLK